MSLASFGLVCSNCHHTLLTATIVLNIDIDNSLEKDILFNEVDLVCPNCRGNLRMIEDDLTRDIQTFWEDLH